MPGTNTEDVTLAELIRMLTRFMADTREDFGDVKSELSGLKSEMGKYVSKELYDAHRLASDNRIADLQRGREADQAQRKADSDRLTTTVRWFVATLSLPIVTLIVTIYFNLKGPS